MSFENPLWGAPKIHGELLKLGVEIAQSTVSIYMVPRQDRPLQIWKTFHSSKYATYYNKSTNSGFAREGRSLHAPDRAVRRYCCGSDPWRATPSIRTNLVFRSDNQDFCFMQAMRLFEPEHMQLWNGR
jgi:hypothetical protein